MECAAGPRARALARSFVTQDLESNPAALADRIARRRRAGLVLAGCLLVLLGAVVSILLSHRGFESDGREGDARPEQGTGADRLRPHATPKKPVPAGAVEVLVVERVSGTPVEGVEVALLRDLRDDEADATTGVTDGDGRVLLRGSFPAILEIRSDAWTSDPLRVATDERASVVIEVSLLVPFVLELVDETSRLAVADWIVGSVGDDASTGTRSDGTGTTTWARRRRAPEVIAATDGRRHVRAFVLGPIPGRRHATLEIPSAVRATTVRCVDEAGRAIVGAVIAIGSAASGVTIPCDERGEATVEYGARDAVALVATAPERCPRALRVDGAPAATVVLITTVTRRFHFRTTDGTVVQEGQRVRGFTRGPASYGIDGAGIDFVGRATKDDCDVAGLPSGPFEGWIWVAGPDVSTIARVNAGDDPSHPIDVIVGPARTFTITGVPPGADGGPSTAVVRVDAVHTCSLDAVEAAHDVEETFARGRAVDRLGACFVVRGPEAEIAIPRSTDPRRVEILTAQGAFACFVVMPDEPGGSRPLAFTDTRAAPALVPTTLRVEWAEGGAAELLSLEIRRDERNAETITAVTDSAGTASIGLAPGRYVVDAIGPDGERHASEGPILVPVSAPVIVRLRASGR